MQDESKHALQTFQTAVDLKFLRSVVRANEIQATLQQARLVSAKKGFFSLGRTFPDKHFLNCNRIKLSELNFLVRTDIDSLQIKY